jgi:hypothetical protein
MGYSLDVVRIPPARFLEIPESWFSQKRFQRDSRVAGFPKSDGIATELSFDKPSAVT